MGRSEGFEERSVGFAGEAEPAVGFGGGTNNTAIDNASSTDRYGCVSNINDTLRRATDNGRFGGCVGDPGDMPVGDLGSPT